MALKRRKRKRRKKIDVGSVLDETLPELASQTKEQLRQKLVALNAETNKRLLGWSRAGKELKKELFITEFKQRIVSKGKIIKYKTRRGMTKEDIIKDITERQRVLSLHTSTVQGGRDLKELKDKRLKDMLAEAGYDYDAISGAKPTLKKIGDLLTRLRDDNYLASTAQTSGYSLGSPTVLTTVFQTVMSHPFWSLDKLYEEITDALDEKEEEATAKRNNAEELLKQVKDTVYTNRRARRKRGK